MEVQRSSLDKMRNYPKCRICGLPVGWYDRRAHLKCIKGKNHHLSKNGRPFYQIDKENNKIITKWDSVSQLERVVFKRRAHVRDVCAGRRKTAYGFIWKYC